MNLDSIVSFPRSVWAFEEEGVRCFLVTGSKYCCLIDTGSGALDVMNLTRALISVPIAVANTHPHSDHTGKNTDFEFLYINAIDSLTFWEIQNPPNFNWTLEPPAPKKEGEEEEERTPFVEVSAGYLIDLGTRKLRVIETPGHTKGSLSFLDEANGILFVGDTLSTRPVMLLDEDSSLDDYILTLEMLQSICKGTRKRPPVETIYCCHGEAKVTPKIIDELLACAQAIKKGKLEPTDVCTLPNSSQQAKIYKKGSAGILLPA